MFPVDRSVLNYKIGLLECANSYSSSFDTILIVLQRASAESLFFNNEGDAILFHHEVRAHSVAPMCLVIRTRCSRCRANVRGSKRYISHGIHCESLTMVVLSIAVA